jgi:gas vesicle protein
MLGEYAALAKWLAIIAAVTALIYTPYNIGRTLERNTWVAVEKDKQILADQVLKGLNDKAMKHQEESTLLAQQLEAQANDHQNEINQLNSDLINAKSHSVQRPGLCANRSAAKPSENHNPGNIVNEPAITAKISEEFERFLISLTKRADDVGVYAEVAHDWIQELCKDKDNFICGK